MGRMWVALGWPAPPKLMACYKLCGGFGVAWGGFWWHARMDRRSPARLWVARVDSCCDLRNP